MAPAILADQLLIRQFSDDFPLYFDLVYLCVVSDNCLDEASSSKSFTPRFWEFFSNLLDRSSQPVVCFHRDHDRSDEDTSLHVCTLHGRSSHRCQTKPPCMK